MGEFFSAETECPICQGLCGIAVHLGVADSGVCMDCGYGFDTGLATTVVDLGKVLPEALLPFVKWAKPVLQFTGEGEKVPWWPVSYMSDGATYCVEPIACGKKLKWMRFQTSDLDQLLKPKQSENGSVLGISEMTTAYYENYWEAIHATEAKNLGLSLNQRLRRSLKFKNLHTARTTCLKQKK